MVTEYERSYRRFPLTVGLWQKSQSCTKWTVGEEHDNVTRVIQSYNKRKGHHSKVYILTLYENISCFGIINMFGIWLEWNEIICDTVILLYKNILKIKFSIV
jgi:hypothetical protein